MAMTRLPPWRGAPVFHEPVIRSAHTLRAVRPGRCSECGCACGCYHLGGRYLASAWVLWLHASARALAAHCPHKFGLEPRVRSCATPATLYSSSAWGSVRMPVTTPVLCRTARTVWCVRYQYPASAPTLASTSATCRACRLGLDVRECWQAVPHFCTTLPTLPGCSA